MRAAFVIAAFALVASASVIPRNGNQFITGPCTKDFDCVSDCCAFTTGKCAGAVIAQTRDGGCGFGEAAPNNRAAIAIQGPNATRAPGVPAPGSAPAPAPAAGGGGGGNVTVQPGDTCAGIAAARGTTPAAVIASNPQINAGCTNLQVGQTLNVGGGGGGAAPAPAAGGGRGVGSSGKGPGAQFITGDCANDGECASGCCALDTGKCAARLVALERKGCGRST